MVASGGVEKNRESVVTTKAEESGEGRRQLLAKSFGRRVAGKAPWCCGERHSREMNWQRLNEEISGRAIENYLGVSGG